MFHKSSRKIVNRLLKNGTICKSDYEIYLFGMEQLLMNVLDIVTVLLIGVMLNMFFHTIFFVVAFMLLRSYAGGYHASTPVRCYLLTTTITIIALSVMKYINFDGFVLFGLYIAASIVILMLAPVESKNKPLDALEIIYYKRKIKLLWGLQSMIALMCGILKFQSGKKGIIFAQVILSVSMIYEKGITKNKR